MPRETRGSKAKTDEVGVADVDVEQPTFPPVLDVNGSEWPDVNGRYDLNESEGCWEHETTNSMLFRYRGRYIIRSSDSEERKRHSFYSCTQEKEGALLERTWCSVPIGSKSNQASVMGVTVKEWISQLPSNGKAARAAAQAPVSLCKHDCLA